MNAHHFDVAIVGAGPAGLAAASVLRGYGLNIVLIDEQPRAGGQILRQPPASFSVQNWLTAKLYERVKALLGSMDECADVSWRLGATVLGIESTSPWRGADGRGPGHALWLQRDGACESLSCDAVLVAAGCYERPLPFPGWTLPGVMGAGAIQAFIKSQQLVPGERFLFAGHHPLQLVVADQLLAAGGTVAGVVFTQPKRDSLRMLRTPIVIARYRRQLTETARILLRLRQRGVPVLFRSSIVRAVGEHRVEGAVIARLSPGGQVGSHDTRRIDCDRIGTCHGFLVSSELARQAGAGVQWREHAGGWTIEHDRWFESSVPNLFVAGEITGMAGADAAIEKGRIAGVGILRALDRIDPGAAERLALPARRQLKRHDAFAATLNRMSAPPPGLFEETVTPETQLCRCESIPFGEVRRMLDENPHVTTADAAKLLSRAGMGVCQGRFCGHHVARVLVHERGRRMQDVGPLKAQIPVKPVTLRALRPAGSD